MLTKIEGKKCLSGLAVAGLLFGSTTACDGIDLNPSAGFYAGALTQMAESYTETFDTFNLVQVEANQVFSIPDNTLEVDDIIHGLSSADSSNWSFTFCSYDSVSGTGTSVKITIDSTTTNTAPTATTSPCPETIPDFTSIPTLLYANIFIANSGSSLETSAKQASLVTIYDTFAVPPVHKIATIFYEESIPPVIETDPVPDGVLITSPAFTYFSAMDGTLLNQL